MNSAADNFKNTSLLDQDYYAVDKKNIYFRKTDIMGYQFNNYYMFNKSGLIRIVSLITFEDDNNFTGLENEIILIPSLVYNRIKIFFSGLACRPDQRNFKFDFLPYLVLN